MTLRWIVLLGVVLAATPARATKPVLFGRVTEAKARTALSRLNLSRGAHAFVSARVIEAVREARSSGLKPAISVLKYKGGDRHLAVANSMDDGAQVLVMSVLGRKGPSSRVLVDHGTLRGGMVEIPHRRQGDARQPEGYLVPADPTRQPESVGQARALSGR
jgi:hypothetical protein